MPLARSTWEKEIPHSDTFFPVGMKLYNDLESFASKDIPENGKEIDSIAGERSRSPRRKGFNPHLV